MVKYYVSGSPMKDTKGYLAKGQLKRLLNACDNPRDKLLLWILMKSGRRISELVGGKWMTKGGIKRCSGLRPIDIDFEGGLISWEILKKRRPMKVPKPIDKVTLQALKRYIKTNRIGEKERIFPITRQRADQIIKKVAERAGIERVGSGKYNKPHLHLLRHSFLIEGAKKAKSPQDIVLLKEIAEHSNINTTMFYLRFNPTDQRELLERMWK